jgi:hypothetical protein
MMAEISPTPEPTDALNGVITGFFNDARARLQSQDFSSVFGDMLKTVQNQPGPTPLPVPASLNPIGQLASVFASTMAEQLGARGSMAAHQERTSKIDERQRAIEDQNILRKDQFEVNKAKQELDIRMKINEARAEQAKQMGDLNEYEARLKGQGALRREQSKIDEASKLKYIDVTNKAILDRVLQETAARGAQARKTANYRMVLKTAVDTTKASDAVKLWGRLQLSNITQKGITGEAKFSPAEQDSMAQSAYTEFLRKQAEEVHQGIEKSSSSTTTISPGLPPVGTGDDFLGIGLE